MPGSAEVWSSNVIPGTTRLTAPSAPPTLFLLPTVFFSEHSSFARRFVYLLISSLFNLEL